MKKARFASVNDKMMNAVLEGLYTFPTESEAAAFLALLAGRFTTYKQKDAAASGVFLLWVRGYDITPEDAQAGAKGNIVRLRHEQAETGEWRIVAEKFPLSPNLHPQRRRAKHIHPNWGHPFLRSVEKEHRYASLEQAEADVKAFQQEYPQAVIPGKKVTYVMIYGRPQADKKQMVTKYLLKLDVDEAGKFLFRMELNTFDDKPARAMPKAVEPSPASKDEPVGVFTAKLKLKRRTKTAPKA